jgi:hypothetical protein
VPLLLLAIIPFLLVRFIIKEPIRLLKMTKDESMLDFLLYDWVFLVIEWSSRSILRYFICLLSILLFFMYFSPLPFLLKLPFNVVAAAYIVTKIVAF